MKILGESYIMCYVCSLRSSLGERHERQTSSFEAIAERTAASVDAVVDRVSRAQRARLQSSSKDARLTRLALGEASFADSSAVRRGLRTRAALRLLL